MKKQEESLVNFNWDDDNSFFGVPAETAPIEDTKKEEEATNKEDLEGGDDTSTGDSAKPNPKPDESTDTTEDDEVFFGTPAPSGDDTGDSTEDATTTSGDTYWKDVYADFKERGLFNHIELGEEEEIDSERLLELQQEEYELEVNTRLKTWAQNDLDEDAQAFIKFKTQGGSTQDFFKTYQASYELPTGEVTDEAYQDKVIRYQLKREGWDADEIEDRLEYLTSSKKKEAVAKRYNAKIQEGAEHEKAELIKQVEAQKNAQKKNEETFKNTIKDTLTSTKEVSGFKITTKDQNNLYNFLTRKQYKTESGAQITGFQKKIGEAFQDPQKMILLAKLIDSDFDMTSFEKKATTKTAKKIKNRLEQHRGTTTSSGSSLGGGAGLADFFNK